MKIALSASGYDNPSVRELLASCEAIYTSQHNNLAELRSIFGDKVQPLPWGIPSLLGFLEDHHKAGCAPGETVEFLKFGDLMDAKRKHEKEADLPDTDEDALRFQFLVDRAEYVPESRLRRGFHRITLDIPNGMEVRQCIDQLMVKHTPSQLPKRRLIPNTPIPVACYPPSC